MSLTMSLTNKFFLDTISEKKLIEFRVNDIKRRCLKLNDIIKFINADNQTQFIEVKIIDMVYSNSFINLIKSVDSSILKYSDIELKELLISLNEIYPKDYISKNGVVGIIFELI